MIAIFGEINLTQYRIFGRRSENFGSGKKSLIQNILQGAKSTIPGAEMGQISIVTRAHNLTQYRRNSGNLTQSGQIMRSLEFYSMHLSGRVRTFEHVNNVFFDESIRFYG
jgi:ABC-type phosphate/phosphonate transport system ATPase subunit